jgi:hypothetical protein
MTLEVWKELRMQAWTRFAAAAIVEEGSAEGQAEVADALLVEWERRFPKPF